MCPVALMPLWQLAFADEEPFFLVALKAVPTVFVVLLGVALALGLAWAVFFLVTLPLRREQRARFFLTLLESGFRQGKTAAQTITQVAQSRDRCLGRRFQAVAAFVAQGAPPSLAVQWAPGFLPLHVVGMLAAGEQAGDLRRVLPACRQSLTAARSRTRAAWRYLLVFLLALLAARFLLRVPDALGVYAFVRLEGMAEEVAPDSKLADALGAAPALARSDLLEAGIGVVVLLITAATALYIGGPRLQAWLHLRALTDRLALRVPWTRKRLTRDFSAMLAALLDAGLPEEDALTLAARSTANRVFLRRSAAAADALKQGEPLPEAVARLDRSGEFRWRLANACHAHAGFREALAGWHDALDAKAWQQEQAASQVAIAVLVACTGAIVAILALGTFRFLVALVETQFLW